MSTAEENREIAGIILNQLGGKKFQAMTGAKNLSFSDKSLHFSIGRNSTKANNVTISLQENDTYKMIFSRATMETSYIELKIYKDIYCDQLKRIFTDYTGLDTSL